MPATATNVVEVSDLDFSYGELSIFRGLSLKIPRGNFVSVRFLGASRGL